MHMGMLPLKYGCNPSHDDQDTSPIRVPPCLYMHAHDEGQLSHVDAFNLMCIHPINSKLEPTIKISMGIMPLKFGVKRVHGDQDTSLIRVAWCALGFGVRVGLFLPRMQHPSIALRY